MRRSASAAVTTVRSGSGPKRISASMPSGSSAQQVALESLHRIQVAFAEHECARTARAVGVGAAHLNERPALAGGLGVLDEAAAVSVDELDVVSVEHVAGEAAKVFGAELQDRLVQLDGGHLTGAVCQRRRDIDAAAHAHDEHAFGMGLQVVAGCVHRALGPGVARVLMTRKRHQDRPRTAVLRDKLDRRRPVEQTEVARER